MGISLQQLRHVVTVAEHGSFVRAAAALHLSQPALSRSIQAAEQRFGTALFQRSARGVTPTDLGRVYIARGRDLLRMADELDDAAVQFGQLGAGRVAVGGGPYPVETFLGPAVARFIGEYPGVGVRLDAGNWDDLQRRLRSRELDFFVAETSVLAREPDVEVVPMPSPQAVHWIARSDHPLASRQRIAATDVFAFPFIAPARIPPRVLEPLLRAHASGAAREPEKRPVPAVQCDGLAAAKRVVANSWGVTGSLLAYVAEELESGRFVVLGTEPWMRLHYGVVRLRRRPWTLAATKLREFVLEAERAAVTREADLLARFGRGTRRPDTRGKARTARSRTRSGSAGP